MKLRKLFRGMLLWKRAVTARRLYKRALKALKKHQIESEAEKLSLIQKYEYKLAIERKRFELLHTEWANRFLQHNNKAPITNALATLEEQVEAEFGNPSNDSDIPLTPDQNLYLMDVKDKFIEDGLAQGKDESEIDRYWQQMLPRVLEDVRTQVH